MEKAKLTFSNGETLILSDEQKIIPIVAYQSEDGLTTSIDKSYEIYYHIHDGLIPSITEMLSRCKFFMLFDNRSKVYSSSAVVTVENI